MIRFFALFALLTLATPAFAADDGGFGTKRFSNQGAVALDEDKTFDPATIEPAAGTEDPTAASDDSGAPAEAVPSDDQTTEDPAAEDATDSPTEE